MSLELSRYEFFPKMLLVFPKLRVITRWPKSASTILPPRVSQPHFPRTWCKLAMHPRPPPPSPTSSRVHVKRGSPLCLPLSFFFEFIAVDWRGQDPAWCFAARTMRGVGALSRGGGPDKAHQAAKRARNGRRMEKVRQVKTFENARARILGRRDEKSSWKPVKR